MSSARARAPLPDALARGVRVAALIEAAKGALVMLVGLGAFTLLHRDLQAEAEQLVRLFHLNPARHTPQVFIDAAARLSDTRLMALAVMALAYAGVRFVEAFGLWRKRRWAEWLAALSGSIYVPIEIYEVWERVTWPRIALLALNVAIVATMAMTLWRTRLRPMNPGATV